MDLPEPSMKMTKKDGDGYHHIWYRYGGCERPCHSFNPRNKGDFRQCEHFRQVGGEKMCTKQEPK